MHLLFYFYIKILASVMVTDNECNPGKCAKQIGDRNTGDNGNLITDLLCGKAPYCCIRLLTHFFLLFNVCTRLYELSVIM